MKMFSVKDSVSGTFASPVSFAHENIVIREYKTAINSHPDSIIGANPQDFALYLIGEFDENSGVITSFDPKFIINLNELKEVKKNEER